jgi:two-component system, chemotaxis family, CheB/CheR fusion protein
MKSSESDLTQQQDLRTKLKLNSGLADFIVGIGCSAGSLSALKAFFSNLPEDTNAAYIIVQHLSPDFKSLMNEILDKHCSLPIVMPKDLQVIENNTVYIMETRQFLSVADGRIILSDIEKQNNQLPIDYFFKSLAEELQNRAIGIVLSGTGNDGTNGVIELNRMGALCIAQDVNDAEFDGMPKGAISSGCCQYILSAAEMGKVINNYLTDQSSLLNEAYSDEFSEQMETIFTLVKNTSNIDFSEYKARTAERRILHRMGVLEVKSCSEYLEYIKRDTKELDLLIKEMLINVTQFFRDRDVWRYMLEHVIKPLLLEKQETDLIRIWVPGCASGEEAFTIAILFEEAQRELGVQRAFRVFATDIDRSSTKDGGEAVFDIRAKDDIPEGLLERYFSCVDCHLIVNQNIRDSIVFAAHNVAFDPPFSNMDIVSCRNLLIYFQPSAQKKILSYFHFSLKTNGHLLLGSAESLGPLSAYYHIIDAKNRVFRKNPKTRISLADAGLKTGCFERSGQVFPTKSLPKKTVVRSNLHMVLGKVKDMLIESFVPSSFLLDDRFNVVYTFGETDIYTKKMKSGASSLHYTSLIHQSITPFITTALKQIEETSHIVVIKNINFVERLISIELRLNCVDHRIADGETYYVLSLECIAPLTEAEAEAETNARRDSQMGQQIKLLDAALLDANDLVREKQQDIEAISEELQCSNEELMAANEELQSSNEELQSVNEELYTVNSEYQEKINELESSNYDLDNLLIATQLGVIYLDKHTLIRKFTPNARDFVNLLPMDLNRPFSDLSLTFPGDKIYDWITSARDSLKSQSYQLETFSKKKFNLSVNPYIDRSDNLEGIILVFKYT